MELDPIQHRVCNAARYAAAVQRTLQLVQGDGMTVDDASDIAVAEAMIAVIESIDMDTSKTTQDVVDAIGAMINYVQFLVDSDERMDRIERAFNERVDDRFV